jgi:tetratricopeptide (TPR) repeat protein
MMPWQRSLEDALQLVEETGKPLLICVNMDGEAASESLARSRYRDPEFAALVEGFIPIIASPSRHQPVDHDSRGWRLVDPRFGRLVESEHLQIEPKLYEAYFNGRRVAPRHVGVAPDGTILFDLFLLNDFSVIDRALKKHGLFDVETRDVARMSEKQLLASADAAAREVLEETYRTSGQSVRRRLVDQAFSGKRRAQHPEIVRMGLLDAADSVRRAAAQAVAENPLAGKASLTRAFAIARHDGRLRQDLARAATDLASHPDADEVERDLGRRLAGVFEGLVRPSEVVDVERWWLALGTATEAEELDSDRLGVELSRIEEALTASPDDAGLNVLLSRTSLALAQRMIAEGGGNPSFLLADARWAAERALEVETPNAEAAACLSRSAYLTGDEEAAVAAALQALPGLVLHAGSALARDTLDTLARVRTRAVYQLLDKQEPVPAAWIAEGRDAHLVLLEHPAATVEDVDRALRFLGTIEAFAEQTEAARRAVIAFPDSGEVHIWFRHCVVRDEGIDRLERAYDRLEVPEGFVPTFEWHAGIATIVAAETYGRDHRREESVAAYGRAVKRFASSVEQDPSFIASANHYTVLALCGMAQRMAEGGDLDDAVERMEEAAALVPSSFAEKDGLGRMPRETVREVERLLIRSGRREDAVAFVKGLKGAGVRL